MREQLGKPVPSPVVLGQVTEKFREAVKALAEQEADSDLPVRSQGTEGRRRQPIPAAARDTRRHRLHRGGAGEGAGLQGKKVDGQFRVRRATRPSTSTTTTSTLMMRTLARCSSRCAAMRRGRSKSVPERARVGQAAIGEEGRSPTKPWTMASCPAPSRRSCSRSAIRWGRRTSTGCSGSG